MQQHPIIKLIEESNYLPKIPKTFGEILNMLLEPTEFNINECVDKFSRLPNVEKALMKVLNYNSNLNVEMVSLKEAVLYLGAKNTRIIAIAYITRLLLPDKNGRAKIFDNKAYWKHCIGTSIASSIIANRTELANRDKMFTYGLIHDIGITVLDICLPESLNKIYTLQLKGVHQIVAEKIVLKGITHEEIGKWICMSWGLPNEIMEILGYHHNPFMNTNVSNEVMIMHLADSISTNYYERLMGNENTFIYSDKVRERLNLSKTFIEGVVKRLPREVERVNNIISFGI